MRAAIDLSHARSESAWRPCCEDLRRTVPSDPGPWLAMVAESLYDAAGRRAFLGRLHQNWRHLERH
jgi:hypothetical protein